MSKVDQHILIQICKVYLKYSTISEFQTYVNNSSINWGKLDSNLRKQGLPFLISLFQMKNIHDIPIDIAQNSIIRAKKIRQRNKVMFRELIITNNNLSSLSPIPYKGLPFAKQFYGNILQRSSVDIDFALDIKHFEKAKKIMLSLGYEEFKSNIDHNTIENSRAYYLDYPFVKRNANGDILFNVEFHWTPSHQILNIPISFKEFKDKTVELKFGEHTLTTFDKVHQALFAVIHHGNVDCWGKLKHLVDFALIIKTLDENETKQLEKLCKKYKIYTSLQIGKGLLAAVFDDKRYKHIKVSRRWRNDILNGELVGKWSDNKMKFWYYLTSRDSFSDKVKAATSIIKYQLMIKSKFD